MMYNKMTNLLGNLVKNGIASGFTIDVDKSKLREVYNVNIKVEFCEQQHILPFTFLECHDIEYVEDTICEAMEDTYNNMINNLF